jgi:hypothetical protein
MTPEQILEATRKRLEKLGYAARYWTKYFDVP